VNVGLCVSLIWTVSLSVSVTVSVTFYECATLPLGSICRGGALGWVYPHWLRKTLTLVSEKFGVGVRLRLPWTRSSNTNI